MMMMMLVLVYSLPYQIAFGAEGIFYYFQQQQYIVV